MPPPARRSRRRRSRLNTFDGRPAYRFRAGRDDDASSTRIPANEQADVSTDMMQRPHRRGVDRPAGERGDGRDARGSRSVDAAGVVPQRSSRCWKYSWPNGEQVYVSRGVGRGRPVHDDRLAARRVPRRDSALDLFHAAAKARTAWSRFVIWSSGIGTVAAILGIVIGVWMYSPSKRYRYRRRADQHSVSRSEALAHDASA